MLKTSSDTTKFSPKEEEAFLAENRRAKAETEYLVILGDKKRVSSELEEIESKIKSSKQIIHDSNEEIVSLNNEILEVKGILRTEKQTLEEFVKEKEIQKSEISDQVIKKQNEKENLISEILSLSKKHELTKFNQAEEIRELESKKTFIVEEINSLTKKEENLNKEIEKLNLVLSGVVEEIEFLKIHKKTSESELISLNNQSEDQKIVIENNKLIVKQQEILINDKKSELLNLDKKIEEKESEYKAIESQAFSILDKRTQLDRKEAFIKNQYERAGIKWEE